MINLHQGRRAVTEVLTTLPQELRNQPIHSWPDDVRTELGLDLPVREGTDVSVCISRIVSTISPADFQQYGTRIEKMLIETARDVTSIFGSLERIAGAEILDIACGARSTTKHTYGVCYEPWRARLLTALGAHVMGVDQRVSEGEPYRHHVLDLRSELLSPFSNDTFDLAIWCGYLWIKPQHQWFGGREVQEHVDALRADVLRVMRPGAALYDGKFIVERK